jgi:hypothetical protein
MSDLSPSQEVHVSGASGGAARVVYVRGNSVRVRMVSSGKERTIPLQRVTPKRESKALSVEAPQLRSLADMVAPMQRVYDSGIRPVPKPVTLRSEPYLAYVRKHPCCLCGASPSEAHHWSHHGGVMGSKVDDYRTVPLCTEHHRHWHDHGTFPEMDREHSEDALMREQAWLLRAWLDNNVAHYGDQVDALIRAIGGADA